jgi:Leu/Phe-tRNA-protein transferase
MNNTQLGIYHLSYDDLTDPQILHHFIYPDMYKNYYWSDDFSAAYYIAKAKAGFIAVTDYYEEEELLLPEIQFNYALLDFDDLHISTKVKKLLQKKDLQLEVSQNLDDVIEGINKLHKYNWLTPKYLNTLKASQGVDENFKVISALIREEGEVVAGEIGYMIGKTYTSLSGFSRREKAYDNYGTAQLVLLAQYLQAHGFSFWNLGQCYMPYKLMLGAKIFEREDFLKRWYVETNQSTSTDKG